MPGTENRGVARAGLRFTRGPVRLDTAALVGATSTDLDIGATAASPGCSRAFRMPMTITKAHAYGNDFLFVPARRG